MDNQSFSATRFTQSITRIALLFREHQSFFCKRKNTIHTCGEERGEIGHISGQLTTLRLQRPERRNDDLGEFMF
jgi:hypothetical protein